MDKHGKPPKKPQPKQPVSVTAGPAFPPQDSTPGTRRNSNVGQDRKVAGRGGQRGR